MPTVYQPIVSSLHGWILGKIVDHVAKTLDEDELKDACAILNKYKNAPKPNEEAITKIVDELWALGMRPPNPYALEAIITRIRALRTKENLLDLGLDAGKRLLQGLLSGKKP